MLEAVFANPSRDFTADAASHGVLVQHKDAAIFLYRFAHGLLVPGQQGAQVEDIGRHAQLLAYLQGPAHAHTVGDDAQLLPFSGQCGLADRRGIVGLGHRAGEAAIQHLMLKVHHRVGVFEGGAEQTLGVVWVAGVHDFQTGHVREPRLVALAVEGAGGTARARGHPHHHVGILAPAVVAFGEVIHNLVEAAGHKIGKLHFDHALLTLDAQTQAHAHNGRLTQRRIPHPRLAKLGHEAFRDFKHPTVVGNVLTHEHEVGEALHTLLEAFLNGIDEAQLAGTGGGWVVLGRLKRAVHIRDFLGYVGRGHRFGISFLKAGFNGGLNFFADAVLGGFCEDAFGDEPLFVVFYRVFGGPLFHQRLGHVLGAAGFFVAAHPEGESFY